MGSAPRRFVTRACVVCEWTGAAVETYSDAPECPWCHAPTKVVREEWLVDIGAQREQAAARWRRR